MRLFCLRGGGGQKVLIHALVNMWKTCDRLPRSCLQCKAICHRLPPLALVMFFNLFWAIYPVLYALIWSHICNDLLCYLFCITFAMIYCHHLFCILLQQCNIIHELFALFWNRFCNDHTFFPQYYPLLICIELRLFCNDLLKDISQNGVIWVVWFVENSVTQCFWSYFINPVK
jgi:hypothetical protein